MKIIDKILLCNFPSITCVAAHENEVIDSFTAEGFFICYVDMAGVIDEKESFLSIVSSLPLGEYFVGLHDSVNLNALNDFFIDVIEEEKKIALIVKNSEYLIENHINLVFSLYYIFISKCQRSKLLGSESLITSVFLGEGHNYVSNTDDFSVHKPLKNKRLKVRDRENIKDL